MCGAGRPASPARRDVAWPSPGKHPPQVLGLCFRVVVGEVNTQVGDASTRARNLGAEVGFQAVGDNTSVSPPHRGGSRRRSRRWARTESRSRSATAIGWMIVRAAVALTWPSLELVRQNRRPEARQAFATGGDGVAFAGGAFSMQACSQRGAPRRSRRRRVFAAQPGLTNFRTQGVVWQVGSSSISVEGLARGRVDQGAGASVIQNVLIFPS